MDLDPWIKHEKAKTTGSWHHKRDRYVYAGRIPRSGPSVPPHPRGCEGGTTAMCRAELNLGGLTAWTMAGLAYGSRPFVVQCNPRGANSQNAMKAEGGDWLGNASVSWLCGETACPPTRAATDAIDLPLIALVCVKAAEMDGRRQARRSWLGFCSLRTNRCKVWAELPSCMAYSVYQASLIRPPRARYRPLGSARCPQEAPR